MSDRSPSNVPYQSSAEHVFARVQQIRARALALLEGRPEVVAVAADVGAEHASDAAHIELRLPALQRRFGLSDIEVDTLVCLLAAEYDPVVRTLERALQRELGKPWLELGTIAELLGLSADRLPTIARALLPDAPLRRWALVHTDDPRGTELPAVLTRVKIATRVAQHLVGQDILPDGLRLCAPARDLLDASLVPADTWQGLVRRLQRGRTAREPVVVEVSGSAGTGRRALVEGLAHVLGEPLVIGNLSADGFDNGLLEERIAVARREAALQGALLALVDWMPTANDKPAIDDGTQGPTRGEHRLPRVIERLIAELTDVVFLVAEEREPLLARIAPTLVHVAVPFPSPGQRGQLLEAAVQKLGARLAEGIDVQLVTRRFALDPERIEIAARGAREYALERLAKSGEAATGTPLTLSVGDLQEACRHQLRHDLKSLAQRVTNAHKWEDLVIPVEVYHSLREMISYVQHAEHVYDRWGFGARHSLAQGVSALFAGPPGTGKTMCASVMARELDMELFRVDLSRIVSKWIGETEKNLGKVFDEADRSNAIILFDEADSLFAKRTEVKSSVDRYANLEINFLLQRMESFGGVTILTTNFEDTIDTAFKRRLTFRMRFEKPDAEARGALWKKIFPNDAQLASDIDLDRLGALYELAGGNIRNAAVRAAFLAATANSPIDMNMCMLAAEREAREMGLLVSTATRSEDTDEEPNDASEDEPAPPARTADAPKASRGRSRVIPVTRPRRS